MIQTTDRPFSPAAGPPRARAFRSSSAARALLVHRPAALVGLGLLLAVVLMALLAGVVMPGDPLRAAGPPLTAPSARYPLGTDDLGRDMWAMVLYGSRTSLLVGLAVALVSAVLGIAIGGGAGYYGHLVDDVLMRLTELVQVVPRFFLVLVAAALFGPSLWLTIGLLGLTFWPAVARLLRAQVLSVREREFVLAARALGAPTRQILWRHVLPNALPVVVAAAALQVGTAILVEAALSFLGLGDRTLLSWGYLLNGAQPFLRVAWWMSVFPGAAIALTVLAVNLVADGLNDALDPRLRQR
jgi:peptide/nickel transport system permease protein